MHSAYTLLVSEQFHGLTAEIALYTTYRLFFLSISDQNISGVFFFQSRYVIP